jgi:hypothetical protein
MKVSKSWLTIAIPTLFATAAFAGIHFLSVTEIASMQSRLDGSYDVTCSDNTREVISAQDLYSNNVCPKKEITSEISSMTKNSEGRFDVICKDQSKVTVAATDILSGNVCQSMIKDGVYTPAGKTLCDQSLVAGYANAKLEKLTIGFLPPCTSGDGVVVTCTGKVCAGVHGPTQQTIQVTVMDSTHYDWLNKTVPSSHEVFSLAAPPPPKGLPMPPFKQLPMDPSGSPAGHL